jgi:RNA polymerase sigma-70 factor, ECF subfamily
VFNSDEDPLRRLAARLLKHSADQDDVLQESWLASLEEGGEPDDPERWRAGVLRNRARRLWEGRRRRGEAEGARASAIAQELDLGEALDRATVREMLQRAIDDLPAEQAEALRLRYFEDLSPTAIAARLDHPLPTVKSRLARGLVTLRDGLDRRTGGGALTVLALARAFDFDARALRAAARTARRSVPLGLLISLAVLTPIVSYFVTAWPTESTTPANPPTTPTTEVAIADPGGATGADRDPRTAGVSAPVESADATTSPAPPVEASAPEMTITVVGVDDESGAPVSGLRAAVLHPDGRTPRFGEASGPDGRVTVRADETWVWRAPGPTFAAPAPLDDGPSGIRLVLERPGSVLPPTLLVPFVPRSERELTQPLDLHPLSAVLVILDEAGEPVPDAQVRVERGTSTRRGDLFRIHEPTDHSTDTEGRVRLEDVHPGPYWLDVVKDGYVHQDGGVEVLPAGESTSTIFLRAAVPIEGVVRDASGAPMAGVDVFDGATSRASHRWVQTAGDGSFRYAHLGPGAHRLWLHSAARPELGASEVLTLEAATVVWNPVLGPTPTLTLDVVDRDGAPLVGRAFVLSSPTSAPVTWESVVVTDERGRATHPHVPSEALRAHLHAGEMADGLGPVPQQVFTGLVPRPDPYRLEVTVDPASLGSFRARYEDAQGRPEVAFQVGMWRRGVERSGLIWATLPAIEVNDLAPAEYLIYVMLPFRGCHLQPFTVDPGEKIDLGVVRLPQPGRVRFDSISDSATPVVHRLVQRLDVFGAPFPIVITYGPTGVQRFELHLQPGSYEIWLEGQGTKQVRSFTVGSEEQLMVTLDAAALEVQVAAEED